VKSFGYHQAAFTHAMWQRWMDRLNAPPPNPDLSAGVEEMRRLLQKRCLGAMQDSAESTGAYLAFVERQFGGLK
jgi:hypothetical protein